MAKTLPSYVAVVRRNQPKVVVVLVRISGKEDGMLPEMLILQGTPPAVAAVII